MIRVASAAAVAVFAFAAGSADARIKESRWLKDVLVTEYYPAPEAWSTGETVRIPGSGGTQGRIDWLYSAWGMSMEGDGVSLSGKRFHIEGLGSQGWVTKSGRKTEPGRHGWSRGTPYWRDVGWRNRRGAVTYRLNRTGWSNGRGVKHINAAGITFERGPSLPLRYWRSVAVDPQVIPLGSRVFVPRYRDRRGGGCMKAQDVGGAIIGKHIDVYRRAPRNPESSSAYRDEAIYVVPPGKSPGRRAPRCLQ